MSNIGPLSTLPPELRNTIYEHILQHPRPITLTILSDTHGLCHLNIADTPSQCFNLTRVCKGLRNECLKLFYSLNSFTIIGSPTRNPCSILDRFRNTIGHEAASAIQKITLDIGTLSMDSFETVCASHQELDAFIQRVASLQASGEWNCAFKAKARFWANYQPADWRSAMLNVEFDMADLQTSWDENVRKAEQAWEEDVDADFKPILFTLRESRHQWLIREGKV
jgi:hypothetical protein